MLVRADLVGVVWCHSDQGQLISLKAGDRVPPGVQLGDHVLSQDAPNDTPDDAPAGNASLEAWQEFAQLQGLDVDGLTRNEIRDLLT